jgi:hypothetical protein
LECNPGYLKPTILQRPGKTRMPLSEFMQGFKA